MKSFQILSKQQNEDSIDKHTTELETIMNGRGNSGHRNFKRTRPKQAGGEMKDERRKSTKEGSGHGQKLSQKGPTMDPDRKVRQSPMNVTSAWRMSTGAEENEMKTYGNNEYTRNTGVKSSPQKPLTFIIIKWNIDGLGGMGREIRTLIADKKPAIVVIKEKKN